MSDDKLVDVFDSIRTLADFIDWDSVELVVKPELSEDKLMGGQVRTKETGREVLVISLPYERSGDFLRQQVDICDAEIDSLESQLEYVNQRRDALLGESSAD